MCEESACLVPPLDASQNGPSDQPLYVPSNGIGINGGALVGFHEDALSQTAVGKAQLLLTLVLGLALAADCSELVIIGYILPSAELQLCIDDHRKGWLVSITLLALSIGSFVWGILGDKLGRRRALVSALSVAGLFSAVGTVMPTYGTFMTARFCSGLGIAGAVPLTFSYLAEICPRATRTRYTGLLHSFWPLGALLTSTLAHLTLPSDGVGLVVDNREHWSSWHQFLILNISPTVMCIVGLVWTSESPRYLLEASREVEALEVYQRLHKLNKSRTQYGLTELELPGRGAYRDRPVSPTTNVFRHGVESFREAFHRVLSPTHYRTTLLLATLHLLLGFLYTGISTFSASMVKDINDSQYNALKRHISGSNYTGTVFNSTLENVEYHDSLFKNVTFRHLEFSHVQFTECIFEDVQFSNVKSSVTYFINSTVKDCRFVDSDLTDRHFLNCNLVNNTFVSLISGCTADFDYNIYLDDLYHETVAWAGPMLPSLLIVGFVLETTARPPVVVTLLIATGLVGIGIFFMHNFVSVLVVEALIKVLLICAVNTLTMVVLEGYPCYLRCSAHGVMRSLYHLAALAAMPIYYMLAHTILLFPAIVTVSLAFVAALLSMRIEDNSKILL